MTQMTTHWHELGVVSPLALIFLGVCFFICGFFIYVDFLYMWIFCICGFLVYVDFLYMWIFGICGFFV